MYHYLYKITNSVNKHYYYGVHNTNNLNDGYMGSGFALKKAYQKYGIENFTKDIIEFFPTMDAAFDKEREVVNEELVRDNNCYNCQIGGRYFNTSNKVTVKDKDGNNFWVYKDDAMYLSGELIPVWKGKHHTSESRQKTRNKMTPSNTNNNRVWICKDGIVKYLRKELLDEYLLNGWELGRVGYKPRTGYSGVSVNATKEDLDKISAKRAQKLHKNKPAQTNKHRVCSVCGCKISKNSKTGMCIKCYNTTRRVIDRPSKDELLTLLFNKSKVQIGKMYGVSDKAIEKWCKYYGLPHKTKDIKHLLNNKWEYANGGELG